MDRLDAHQLQAIACFEEKRWQIRSEAVDFLMKRIFGIKTGLEKLGFQVPPEARLKRHEITLNESEIPLVEDLASFSAIAQFYQNGQISVRSFHNYLNTLEICKLRAYLLRGNAD